MVAFWRGLKLCWELGPMSSDYLKFEHLSMCGRAMSSFISVHQCREGSILCGQVA